MFSKFALCVLHSDNGQDLEERERLLQEMTSLRMFMDIVRISVVASSSKAGNGDVLALQSMLEGGNVLQLHDSTAFSISEFSESVQHWMTGNLTGSSWPRPNWFRLDALATGCN